MTIRIYYTNTKNKPTTAHCTSRFKRLLFISSQQHLDINMELTRIPPRPPEPDPSV